MSDKLINADRLYMYFLDKVFTKTYWAYYEIEEAIDAQPAVEAEPVRHGRWDTEVITDRLGMKHCYYACSVCGRLQDDETPFCALCGAKMDGGEDAGKKETD